MLQRLKIQNYALIEHLDMKLHSGFSTITGETGAGKSIILGALGMILGQRADMKVIKADAKRCMVEATFNLNGLNIQSFFDENDLDYDEDECIIRRELSQNGKSRAFINDTPVSLIQLKELSSHLIDIHSQHQNLLLNQERFQIETLDTMAKNHQLKERFQHEYDAWLAAQTAFEQYCKNVERERENKDFLQFQLDEIERLHLKGGEQQGLEEEAGVLNNAENIKQVLYKADSLLSEEESGITSMIYDCQRCLQDLTDCFPKARKLHERLESCAIEIEDIAQEIAQCLENVIFDPERQNYVNERLSSIYALAKKHHCESEEELIQVANQLRLQLDELDCSDEQVEALRKECQERHKTMLDTGRLLSSTRNKTVPKIEKEMRERLQKLGMPNIRFTIEMTEKKEPSREGLDRVAFLFSANRDMSLRNIAEIASGGEMARVMLSLKALLASKEMLPTIIFDEIDTGVSGKIAEQMALMMKSMSQNGCQVISITHLPQIAALGNFHYKVYKQDDSHGTSTHISNLTPEERIVEIAHMLSGSMVTDAAIDNAKELLKQSRI